MKFFLKSVFILQCLTRIAGGWLSLVRSDQSGFASRILLRNNNSTSFRTVLSSQLRQIECRKDKHCGIGSFCHKHYKTCHLCRIEGHLCRRNAMCCRGMECVSGMCRPAVASGLAGATCRHDRDCNFGLCCAKSDGASVCKRMLQEGDACDVSEGGIAYTLNHNCPCDFGLKCKRMRKKDFRKLKKKSGLLPWLLRRGRRCIRYPQL